MSNPASAGAFFAPKNINALYVDHPYSNNSEVNSRNISNEGHHLKKSVKVGQTYHFEFSDGTIRRFLYKSKSLSIKFVDAGPATDITLTTQDAKDLHKRFPFGHRFLDFFGLTSLFATARSFISDSGFFRGTVIIEECKEDVCEEVHSYKNQFPLQ